MPVAEINDEKLVRAMARLDKIQHPRRVKQLYGKKVDIKPPLPPDRAANVQRLPELSTKAMDNYKILKGRVDLPATKLESKYWSETKDRFADMSRLSAETAPAALQISFSSAETSPQQSRVVTPATRPDAGLNKRREMAIFKTSKLLKKRTSSGREKHFYSSNASQNTPNKYRLLRSRSFAEGIHEEDEGVDDNGEVKVTVQDLAEFTQATLEQDRNSGQREQMKTSLYNSFVDVQKFRKILKDPSDIKMPVISDTRWINYCGEDKSLQIQKWLIDVHNAQTKEGYWTEIIDKSLIKHAIPKCTPGEIRSHVTLPHSDSPISSVSIKIRSSVNPPPSVNMESEQ